MRVKQNYALLISISGNSSHVSAAFSQAAGTSSTDISKVIQTHDAARINSATNHKKTDSTITIIWMFERIYLLSEKHHAKKK